MFAARLRRASARPALLALLAVATCGTPPFARAAAPGANFAPVAHPLVEMGANGGEIAVGDLDGDGRLDLVGGCVSVPGAGLDLVTRLGLGGGQFGERLLSPGFGGYPGMLLGDFDGDHHLDLVSAGGYPGTQKLTFARGRGDGTFFPETPVPLPTYYGLSTRVSDLDADGFDDVVVLQTSYLADTAFIAWGGATPFANFTPLVVSGGLQRPAVADFDGDTRLDLAFACRTSADVKMFRGLGGRAFAPPVSIPSVASASGTETMDLDHDGDADLVVLLGLPTPAPCALLRNVGAGVFGPPVYKGSGGYCFSAGFGDADGDALTDIVLAAPPNGLVVLAAANGYDPAPLFGSGPVDVVDIEAVDLDADGDLDVLGTHSYVSWITWITGPISAPAKTMELTWPGGEGDVMAADFDRDGIRDLVTGTASGPMLFAHGHGDGTFEAASYLPFMLTSPRAVDADGDGDIDLAGIRGSFWAVQLNDGAGHLGTAVTVNLFSQPFFELAGDFNEDGFVDAIAWFPDGVTQPGPPPRIALSNGPSYPPSVVISGFNRPGSTASGQAAVDFDHDGHLDVLLDGVMYHGDGLGHFSSPAASGFYGQLECLGDFDEDGRLDAITQPQVHFFVCSRGLSDGTFEPGNTMAFPGFHDAYQAADVNGDGHLDLVALGRSGVSVLRGRGDRTFEAPESYSTYAAQALAIARIDGDARPDLVLHAPDISRIQILLDRFAGFVPPLDAGTSSGARLAIRARNPVAAGRGVLTRVTLPSDAPVTLELFDVTGRCVGRAGAAALGAGTHELQVPVERGVRGGVYFLRASQAGAQAVARVSILR